MNRKYIAPIFLLVTVVLAALAISLRGFTFQILEPHGIIAAQERGLIIHALLLMLIVVVPVFILAFTIAWRYRAGNTKATYTPNWENSRMEELIWWAIPMEIILVLGALTWSSTHALDPYKPIDDTKLPLTVQVVALDWKWLFIYPSLGIATINELALPVNQPVEFSITADAPMNSFWIPQLGGQIYAMTGMSTKLNLEATDVGIYRGSSANYSGEGFADMKFDTTVLTQAQFNDWVSHVKESPTPFDAPAYRFYQLPGTSSPQEFGSVDQNLYNDIVMQFMQRSDMHMDTAEHHH